MADLSFGRTKETQASGQSTGLLRLALPAVLLLASVGLLITLFGSFQAYTPETEIFLDSTLGELAVWMSDQSAEDAPESLLGQYARTRSQALGTEQLSVEILLGQIRGILLGWSTLIIVLTLMSLFLLAVDTRWSRYTLIGALLLTNALLFNIPVGDNTMTLILLTCFLMVGALVFTPGPATKLLGFVVVLSLIVIVWEAGKAFAASINYQITTPVANWTYTTYPSLDDALSAIAGGEVDAIIADRSEVRDIIAPYPPDEPDPATTAYPDLRYLTALDTHEVILNVLPITPEYSGRLSVVTRADNLVTHISELSNQSVAAVAGSFAEERYLSPDRKLVLLDLKIANDINLPHLQNITEAFLQPARRNGPLLLIRILSQAALHTWSEAILGFAIGASLGFCLGTAFAHFAPIERGLLPYVVASQTIPILAIAPMVVIWLGAGPVSVAVISAYLTFFPVTINTLRGLRSPHPNALELLQSYAASKWEIMWKLRFPAALPYIFTALKVSATASVVGAIIGELPSSIRNGLGRAILDFSSDYSLVSTPKLWAAILVAASIGILSFVIVNLVEYFMLRGYVRSQ